MSGNSVEHQPPRALPAEPFETDGVVLKPRGVGARVSRRYIQEGSGFEIIDNRGDKPTKSFVFTPTRQRVRDTSKYNPRDEDRKHARQRREKP
ncbi:MAG TPA: hypothetical protein VNE18_10350 [Rhodanobacter sp.]|nr:hypothetical protein [Rhodanobacter sp.]